MNVVVLGASGMLGSMVLDWLRRDSSLRLIGTVRSQDLVDRLAGSFDGVGWRLLDAARCRVAEIQQALDSASWVVNAIGVIKPYIRDDDAAQAERAVLVNALFPHLLAQAAAASGCRVLQIATDCVYSGSQGAYPESAGHDALDVYGKTKSLGEVHSPAVHHLRCSIIGPEPKAHLSLLDWFRRQSNGASVGGYVNHQWNGVTTLQFARLCHGIITTAISLPHLQHVVPAGRVSKCELLRCFAWAYRRDDVTVNPTEAKTIIDRTLATANEALNRQLWEAAGYTQPPSVPEMVAELAGFDYRLESD